MIIHMNSGRTLERSTVTVIDVVDNIPVGLIRYDGGRFVRVEFLEGEWWEHRTDWRIYDTIAKARQHRLTVTDEDEEVADALAELMSGGETNV